MLKVVQSKVQQIIGKFNLLFIVPSRGRDTKIQVSVEMFYIKGLTFPCSNV